MLGTREACSLRGVCHELKQAVGDFPWEDMGTVIMGSIGQWRACFPRARGANVMMHDPKYGPVRRTPVVDGDFVHFVGLRALNMSNCRQVTDAAFVHLVGIQRLSIWGCSRATITDAAFVHLKGIKVLNMSLCRQLTDAAFEHLKGIHTLYMWYCDQDTITNAAFEHLKGIHSLVMP